jgi:hypothetical protein
MAFLPTESDWECYRCPCSIRETEQILEDLEDTAAFGNRELGAITSLKQSCVGYCIPSRTWKLALRPLVCAGKRVKRYHPRRSTKNNAPLIRAKTQTTLTLYPLAHEVAEIHHME